MKVLFINPLIKNETQPSFLSSLVFSSPPLGLAYIAGYLREKYKADLEAIDEVATPLSDADLISFQNRENTAFLLPGDLYIYAYA